MFRKQAFRSLVPAAAVIGVLALSWLVPTHLPFGSLASTCGYGYGYGYGYGASAAVTGVSPNQGSTAGGTTVSVTGSGFCNGVSRVDFGGTAATSFIVESDTLLEAVSPAHVAGTVDVTVTNNASTSAITPADEYTFVPPGPPTVACSTSQFTLTGSNGSTWVDISGTLSISFTPTVDSFAVLNGNADLWTSTGGINQDLGITVNGTGFPSTAGQPEAWKESGGFAGTFSPNAANAQTVISVLANTTYTARLQWKANKSTTGKIWAGAGPISGRFSPTCISVRLIPLSSASVVAKSSTSQYHLTSSNGVAWTDIDATNLSVSYTPTSNGFLVLAGNADLWTANAGYNQDIAINLDGSIAAWKESGGFAGTFSPNAAFVLDVAPVASGTAHTAKLQWKTNKPASGTTIYAGAGPIGGKFSPTSISLFFLPATEPPIDKVSTSQYHLTSNNGVKWEAIDSFSFTLSYTPTNDCQVILGGNSDLWTANAGYNQDIGISIVDTAFPSTFGQPEGWKESGGFNGTFSPNAAYVQVVASLQGGHTYTMQLLWKANKSATGKTIYAGAGPIAGQFSPTRLTLQPIGC